MIARNWPRLSLTAVALATAALLSACGGGAETDTAATAGMRDFVAQIERKHPMSAAEREAAQAITAAQVDAKALFDWAEYKLPSLFPKGPQNLPNPISYLGNTYTVRAYPNGNFLGLRQDGAVFALGPFTGNALQQFGRLADYVAAVVAEQCQVNPASCASNNEPTGPINDCTMPAANALAPGTRLILDYEHFKGDPAVPTGSFFVDSVVQGDSVFEGQAAVKIASTYRGTILQDGALIGLSGTATSFSQVTANGHDRHLGGEDEQILQQGSESYLTRDKVVQTAGGFDEEFTLQLGQTLTKQVTLLTTHLVPTPVRTENISLTLTITFEARETLTVPAGTFATCRYRTVDNEGVVTVAWFIVGRGVAAKTQTTALGVIQTELLRSGSFNGGPL